MNKINMERQVIWQNNPNYNIDDQEVHIWKININDFLANKTELFAILDRQEKNRANRFIFEKDKDCLIYSHAALRVILSQYLKCDPQTITYEYNAFGKPISANNNNLIHFNLSHSHKTAIIAINKNEPIGIDIEYMRAKESHSDIAKRFFSAQENVEYKQLPEQLKTLGFYNAWTRKEAFIKAIGEGLTFPLKNFTVNLTPDSDVKIISINNETQAAENWQLFGFFPEEEYCGAVAWQGAIKNLHFFHCKF